MPIYEYSCDKCGVVEVLQRITDAPIKRCPNCGGKVERLLSKSSFILKGSGWYLTDYARKGASSPSEPVHANGKTNSEAGSTDTSSTKASETPKASTESASSDKPSPKSAD